MLSEDRVWVTHMSGSLASVLIVLMKRGINSKKSSNVVFIVQAHIQLIKL